VAVVCVFTVSVAVCVEDTVSCEGVKEPDIPEGQVVTESETRLLKPFCEVKVKV